jgi:hypothetical protein
MYIQQSIPQITIHLLYIDTLQQVECDIMYIQQSIPQITIHLLYSIYNISQFTCCMVSIYNQWIVICCHYGQLKKTLGLKWNHNRTGEFWYIVYTTEYTTNHNPIVVYRQLTTGGLYYDILTTDYILLDGRMMGLLHMGQRLLNRTLRSLLLAIGWWSAIRDQIIELRIQMGM